MVALVLVREVSMRSANGHRASAFWTFHFFLSFQYSVSIFKLKPTNTRLTAVNAMFATNVSKLCLPSFPSPALAEHYLCRFRIFNISSRCSDNTLSSCSHFSDFPKVLSNHLSIARFTKRMMVMPNIASVPKINIPIYIPIT